MLLRIAVLLGFVLTASAAAPPNVIIIFTDDQGYGDVGVYGAAKFRTPHLDRMAREGARFTNFYVAAPVCTPSRAALLTGSHPVRVGLGRRVLFPYSNTGLHPGEITLAELLQEQGYATGIVGKWHLGHHKKFLPIRQGFDSYFGIPYSNDMGNHWYARENFMSPPTPILRDERLSSSSPTKISSRGATPKRLCGSFAATKTAPSSSIWLTACRTGLWRPRLVSPADRNSVSTAT